MCEDGKFVLPSEGKDGRSCLTGKKGKGVWRYGTGANADGGILF